MKKKLLVSILNEIAENNRVAAEKNSVLQVAYDNLFKLPDSVFERLPQIGVQTIPGLTAAIKSNGKHVDNGDPKLKKRKVVIDAFLKAKCILRKSDVATLLNAKGIDIEGSSGRGLQYALSGLLDAGKLVRPPLPKGFKGKGKYYALPTWVDDGKTKVEFLPTKINEEVLFE